MRGNNEVNKWFINQFFLSINAERQELSENDEAPLVKHDLTNQITYVVKGEGIGMFGDEIRALSEGDVIMIPLSTPHSFKSKSKTMEMRHYHWPQDHLETDRIILRDDISGILNTS